MSISKLRGKSAIAIQNDGNNNKSPTDSKLMKPYVPATTTSLLKIEPFVPTFSSRFRKPIYRSYSTLSSTYFKRITDQKHNRVGRFPERGLLQHQRSKSTLSTSTTKSSQNGVCRVARAAEDQEKLPDRINYDRRGLTAIPIFENESNLRLLSLQHNLINVFHVPDETAPTRPASSCEISPSDSDKHSPDVENFGSGKTYQKDGINTRLLSPGNIQHIAPGGLGSLSSTGTTTIVIPNSSSMLPTSPHTLSPNAALMKHSFVKKSTLLHAHQRVLYLQKSKSFMNQHSQHLGVHVKSNIQPSPSVLRYSPASSVINIPKLANDVSNSNAGPETDNEKTPDGDIQSLKVQNNQLNPSYGVIFENLVFLDLYDNQIEKISNLDGLKNLTVLLLGKNRISDITGLASLKNTLRVLDLHGNKISNIINKINCLQHLKSLNLAGNQIRQINATDFAGMVNLKELNLKRNRIKRVYGFIHLISLERLWLCHNDIHRVEDMLSIGDATHLQEVTIENNPVSLAGDCVSFLVSFLPNLMMLSQMPITDQVRAAAMAWRRNKELANENQNNADLSCASRREEIISNARTNWELLRSQQVTTPSASSKTTPSSNSSQLGVSSSDKKDKRDSEHPRVKLRQSSARPKGAATAADKRKKRKEREKDSMESDFANFFRLPPINQCQPAESKTPSEKTHSSGSSLGPNIDSSSSCYSSDGNEEPTPASPQRNVESIAIRVPQVNEQPALECEDVSYDLLPNNEYTEVRVIEEEVAIDIADTELHSNCLKKEVCVVEGHLPEITCSSTMETSSNLSDKASNISSSSVRCDSELTVPNGNQTEKLVKSRMGSISNRRYMQGTLVRSQTARARVSTVNSNQQLNQNTNLANASSTQGSSAASSATKAAKPIAEREREQGGDYLIEICGRYLNVYGLGALRFIDKQWNTQKANDVSTLNFSYVNFNNIAGVLSRIKGRFQNAESFVFRETNITSLGQLNALAELQGITSLTVDTEGNPICEKKWRLYAIYRLSHWGLKTINSVEISESEIEQAHSEFIGLSDLVLWSLPETLLQPLLARLRLDETCTASKLSAKEWLMKADQSLKVVVGKEALQWKKPVPTSSTGNHLLNSDQDCSLRDRGTLQLSSMIDNTCNAVEKLQMLENLWPNLLLDIVRNTLLDYSQLDVYVKNLMSDIMK